MNEGTYGLETLKADYHTILGYDIGYVTAESYPLFAPYRAKDKQTFSGRVPRLLSIIITTLVNTPSREWNAETRTLTIGEDFFYLANKCGLNSGGDGRTTVRDRLLMLTEIQFTDMDGNKVTPVSHTDINPDFLTVEHRRITFTEQFVRMMTRNVRQLPLKCLYPNAGSGIGIDLLVLSALYCPENHRLIIEREDISSLLPASSQSLSTQSLLKRFKELNDSQNEWTYRMTKHSVTISPFGVYSSEDAIRLRRKNRS